MPIIAGDITSRWVFLLSFASFSKTTAFQRSLTPSMQRSLGIILRKMARRRDSKFNARNGRRIKLKSQ